MFGRSSRVWTLSRERLARPMGVKRSRFNQTSDCSELSDSQQNFELKFQIIGRFSVFQYGGNLNRAATGIVTNLLRQKEPRGTFFKSGKT